MNPAPPVTNALMMFSPVDKNVFSVENSVSFINAREVILRTLLLTQWYIPEPNNKAHPLAKELIQRGYEVEVLTGFPNYPAGQIYDGYHQRIWQREKPDGVPIIRVPLYPNHSRSGLKRIF